MSFSRHGEIYHFDEGATLADHALAHRNDEFPAGYSSASCSPAVPASASPAGAILLRLILNAKDFAANGKLSLITVSHPRGSLHFLCFKTEINKGLRYSKVDVIGVRDVGGELSGEVQTIAVEVKREGSPFATTSGQTLGYNVYANRVYLAEARKEPFSPDEMDIASHLGIGLIQIRDKRCVEVLSSPFYTPIRRLNLLLLEALGLGRCQFCDSFFETGNTENPWALMVRGEEPSEVILKAMNNEKGLMFWNVQVAERKKKLGLTKVEKGESKERRF